MPQGFDLHYFCLKPIKAQYIFYVPPNLTFEKPLIRATQYITVIISPQAKVTSLYSIKVIRHYT
jgi:hypothetical protein